MLTPLELDVMKAVWRHQPITVRDVQQAIRPSRKLAYTTVMTIMDRLYHKGFLGRTLQSRTHYYESSIAYTAVRDDAVDTLVERFFGSKEKLREFLNGNSTDNPPRSRTDTVAGPALDETLL